MSNLNTELLNAAKNGDIEKVKSLISEGADVNVVDKNGDTPLIWAATNGHKETVETLLKVKGIDVNVKGQYGYTPLHSAA
ncbi:ankyrin repeat domain-containing protein [Wolbachia endosymbiont of Cimex lectularius]|uniref:ankyrin repeat domain-containing protein n=1 Tax=Wolbachia endosymbiont of Cimex lectularius TaxID=246273 RepID=UPI00049B419E|nr:ankyrin repeat domain-containing protein [Wolbachia endosymbiont of Cimex lectularius]BAO99459.1 ankyrin repeat-containing protein [Wolbachia endosymbiont of Cimex lectularius]